jgi:hypothetical protein
MRYHAAQWAFWKDDAKFIVCAAGRRSGKTEIAKRKIVYRAIEAGYTSEFDDPRFFFTAPTHLQAKRIYWPWLKRYVPQAAVGRVYESELMIRLCHGAEMWVMGLDKPQRIEGVPWDGGVLDEYANMKKETWAEHVQPCLADRDGFCMMIGVPEGRNHFYETAMKAQVEDDWSFYTWKSAEILPPKWIKIAQRDLDPRTFRQEYEASFEEALGRIYYGFERKDNVKRQKKPAKPEWVVGMDFNVHPMAAVVGWAEKDTFHCYRDWEIPSSNTEELGQRIKNEGFFPATIYPDPTGRRRTTSAKKGTTDFSILRNLGFKVVSRLGPPPVRDRYNAVNTRLCSGSGERRLEIDPKCKFLIRALDGITYDDEKGDLSHVADALGYPIEYLYPVVPIHAQVEGGQF